jgi:hypothetical protein
VGGGSRFLRFGAGTQSAGIGGRRAFLIVMTTQMNANPASQWGHSRQSRCTLQAWQQSAFGVNAPNTSAQDGNSRFVDRLKNLLADAAR